MPSLPFLDPTIVSGPTQVNITGSSPGQAGIPFVGLNAIAGVGIDLSAYQKTSEKDTANGYAGLGADGKISLSLLPDANALESEAIAFAVALG